MIGLLERVDNAGANADIFDLAVEVGKEFGKILELIKAAELLDFVDTPKPPHDHTAAAWGDNYWPRMSTDASG